VADIRLVPPEEFARVQAGVEDRLIRLALLADMCRINTLNMVKKAGSGHLGSSFSRPTEKSQGIESRKSSCSRAES